jgi:hypothetical protein
MRARKPTIRWKRSIPLLNYGYPTLRLIVKEKQASGRYQKIYEKEEW